MLFYRSPASEGAAAGPRVATLRALTVVALAAYPAGALLLRFGGADGPGLQLHEIFGFALLLLTLAAAAPVLGSRLQRIVGDDSRRLDEMELHLRHKATSWAYFTFTALVCLAIFYAGAATDAGLWLPREFDEWNGVFWGVFLYSSLLPTLFLAWTLSDEEDGSD